MDILSTKDNTQSTNWLLRIEDLKICFRRRGGRLLPVVDTANLSLQENQAIGIVGESGSGKTMLCRAIIGTLHRHGALVTSGEIIFKNQSLVHATEQRWRKIRGRHIGYVPQSSLAGLNPVLTIGTQLIESITATKSKNHHQAKREAIELLDRVRISRPEHVFNSLPHQLSGGMRQRVMIAAAIVQKPDLLIADEPTTALDVTVQREILNLIKSLLSELGMSLILVSHDLAVIEEVCDSLMVMYAGASVEVGPVERLANSPRHPYTRALRVSRVDLADPGEDLEAIPGSPASIGSWAEGCRFWPRCPLAIEDCKSGLQPPLSYIHKQMSACILADQVENV
ncbi:MAG: ABC transporter ATP-binding protein [Anaerolineales bacterium]|jgi:oligopeptide/dipeptide ABC transporter ATP-binding protein